MKEKFKKVISFLLKRQINFWRLLPHVGYLPEFVVFIKKLQKGKFLEIKNSNLILTEKGERLAKKLKIKPLSLPPKRKIKIKNKKILKEFKKLRKKKEYKGSFDQLPLSAESVILKIEFMEKKGDLEGKKILCIGDDDFVALALMLTKLPKEIGVIDIDPEVINPEKNFAKKIGFKVNFYLHDLTKPLPKKIKRKYDVFISEPPDTIEGHLLFFSRAIECLKREGGVGYIGITQASLSPKKRRKIQENILKMGGVITDALHHFEVYDTIGDEFQWISGLPKGISLPKENWFFADLWRIEVIQPKPLIKGEFKKPFVEEVLMTQFNFDKI